MMTKYAKKVANKYLEKAKAAFMVMYASLGKKQMTQELPKAFQDAVIASHTGGKIDAKGISFRVDLFGSKQEVFKRLILRPRAAIRTYLDNNTTAFSRGKRLALTTKVPEILTAMKPLKQYADECFAEFLPHYREYCEQGRIAADAKFPDIRADVRVNGRIVYNASAGQLLRFPTKKAFVEAFYTEIGVPKPLTITTLKDCKGLPPEYAADIAARNNVGIEQQLIAAKRKLMEKAEKAMKVLVTQLSKGERLHDTLLTNAKDMAQQLRDFTDGYDSDVDLLKVADIIDNDICVSAVDKMRDDKSLRKTPLKYAKNCLKAIQDVGTRIDNAEKAKPTKAEKATQAASPLADLID
jgi:hypothetical protein